MNLIDVTGLSTEIDRDALNVISWAPAWMTRAERLLLFALIFGLRPRYYLEIGTFQGGSALIVAAAMDASGTQGKMVCVDPEPRIAPENLKRIEHRAIILRGRSPEILAKAACEISGAYDFVLIDGDHTSAGVMQDAEGVLPLLARGGYLLFHDAYFLQVARALDEFASRNVNQVLDLGCLTREITIENLSPFAKVYWGGLRLMRKK
jgi:predicted O-methyltransferase YrrM